MATTGGRKMEGSCIYCNKFTYICMYILVVLIIKNYQCMVTNHSKSMYEFVFLYCMNHIFLEMFMVV